MSDDPWNSWSNDPDTPKLPRFALALGRSTFAGILVGSILYGTLVALFFQCMAALLNPVHRRGEGVKWGLVSYTVIMFSFATVHAANLNIPSISLIDNPEFSAGPPAGPAPYKNIMVTPTVLGLTPNVVFALSNWLADGLLLYRCYIIYSTNPWAIAFPCLVYLACVAMGIATLVDQARGEHIDSASVAAHFGLPYLSITVFLNVFLTLMIVVRLVLHSRDVRAILGPQTIITTLVESCALFAMNSLLVVGLSVAGNYAVNTFIPILAETQVIAPLLIIQRVANKSALTCDAATPESIGLFSTGTQEESTSPSGTPPGWDLTNSVGKYGNLSDQLGVRDREA